MENQKFFIIDFDSTIIQVEALEELAEIALKGNPRKHALLEQIKSLTEQGMEGTLPFAESLEQRLKLLEANKSHLELLIKRLHRKLSISFERNREFFQQFADQIFIVSGGFKEFIVPIIKTFHLHPAHVYANTFVFDEHERIVGFEKNNLLAQKDGKVAVLKSLQLAGDIYVIGDGYTDYQMKAAGLANIFYAFTENVQRENIIQKADHVAPSLDEFLYLNKLPMAISYPKNRISVLLLENLHPNAHRNFENEGYQIESVSGSLDETELAARIKNVSILGIRSKTKITANVLRHANRLMAIGVFCIGTDHIDLSACQRRGISAFNAPFSNTRSVVEMALGEIIILIRGIFEKSNKLKNGVWDKSAKNNFEVRGKKLGIIGYGKIGSQLSVLAEFLGMEVYYYDIVEKLALGNAKKCKTLPALLKKVDIVSVHVDGRQENRNLIGEKDFQAMRDGVIFLNLSRGSIVDTAALTKYLRSGKIRGAAVDVFPEEPKSNAEPFISELQQFPNVILTPHIGGSTEEAQQNIAEFVTGKIIDYINTGNLSFSVNLPEIQLPELQNAHRLIHIHENKPGLLAQINAVLAARGINIVGQYLRTNSEIGYVITDISKEYDQGVIEDLKKIPQTIKFRILY
jgi:D-3-phosphoglycerate dehydrogenase